MKKTLVVLSIIASGIASAAVTLHDTTFDTTITSAQALQNAGTPTSSNFDIHYFEGQSTWTSGSVNNVQGLYFHDGAGLKFNHHSNVTVTYLYLGTGISFQTGTGNVQGAINWSSSGHNLQMSNAAGAWVDINDDYGTNISIANMSGGSVYLNEDGTLNSTLDSSNTVYATALFEDAVAGNSLYTDNGDGTYTRTLLSGNYEGWTGDVVMEGAKVEAVNATSTGLSVTYVAVPEPATASLSLLGLAALMLRRRRA